jgi:hypothetical protein
MSATLDPRKAFLTRRHGDLLAIFSWVNDERALILLPARRPGAPWYVVMESAAHTWDDSNPANVPAVAAKALRACEVLGLEPTPRNAQRVAAIVIDGLPDLIRMPAARPAELHPASIGRMTLRADGQTLAEQDLLLETGGATYA